MLKIHSWYILFIYCIQDFFSTSPVKGITCAARFVFGIAAYNAVVCYHLTQSVVICAQKGMK